MHEALLCPRCGAPLAVREETTIVLCIYCNTSLRVASAAPGASRTVEARPLGESDVARVKELLALGRREDAVGTYQAAAQCDGAEAEATIAAWSTQLVVGTMSHSMMGAFGISILVFALALTFGGVAGVTVLDLPTAPAVAAITVGALITLVMMRSAVRTLRYLAASSGTATILRHVFVGKYGSILSYRLLLEVRSASGAFQTDVLLPVGEASVAKIQPGYRFRVRFFPGDPSSVIFAGRVHAP